MKRLLVILGMLFVIAPAHVSAEEQSEEVEYTTIQILVRSSPLKHSLFDYSRPVSVLAGQELLSKLGNTLGETVSGEAGVAATSYGPGASRPIIRGLGGDRIRILENGVGSSDVSNTSPDHLVTIDPFIVDQIEVIRGPETLLYGSNAVGGIVNVFDGRIPETLPRGGYEGALEARGATVNDEGSFAGKVNAAEGNLVFSLLGSMRESNDIRIPGFARSKAERDEHPLEEGEEAKGRLPYSDARTDSIGTGLSYIGEGGFIGASINNFDSDYGVPNGEEDVSIEANRKRVDLRGQIDQVSEYIEHAKLNIGGVDYEHTEFEGGEEGTIFKNEGIDSRFEVKHNNFLNLEGVVGLQVQRSLFEAIGAEAFQPETRSQSYSFFVFEQLPVNNRWKIQVGGRLDWNALDSRGFEEHEEEHHHEEEEGHHGHHHEVYEGERPGALSNNTATFSQSAGIVWLPVEDYTVSLSTGHTERAPTGQERYSFGSHIATAAFEVGDPDLSIERSVGVDLTARKEAGFVRGQVSLFYNRFNNFIDLVPTDEELAGFTVFNYTNRDVDLMGFETKLEMYLIDNGAHSLSFDVQPDYVYARERDGLGGVPRITPARIKTGVTYDNPDLLTARLEFQHVLEQSRTATFERETPAYTFMNLYLSKDIKVGEREKFQLFLKGNNLLNEKARDHTSFIKEVAPLPGLNVTAGVRFAF